VLSSSSSGSGEVAVAAFRRASVVESAASEERRVAARERMELCLAPGAAASATAGTVSLGDGHWRRPLG
jgi:hypothetical protein